MLLDSTVGQSSFLRRTVVESIRRVKSAILVRGGGSMGVALLHSFRSVVSLLLTLFLSFAFGDLCGLLSLPLLLTTLAASRSTLARLPIAASVDACLRSLYRLLALRVPPFSETFCYHKSRTQNPLFAHNASSRSITWRVLLTKLSLRFTVIAIRLAISLRK